MEISNQTNKHKTRNKHLPKTDIVFKQLGIVTKQKVLFYSLFGGPKQCQLYILFFVREFAVSWKFNFFNKFQPHHHHNPKELHSFSSRHWWSSTTVALNEISLPPKNKEDEVFVTWLVVLKTLIKHHIVQTNSTPTLGKCPCLSLSEVTTALFL